MSERSRLAKYIIANLDNAIKNEWIKVYYQPEIRSLSGRVCGYETLARWQDPKHGMLSPAAFIGVLEEHNLIHKLDLYVIDKGCSDLALLREYGGGRDTRLSVNLSRRDFELCDIFTEVDKIRQKYQLSPEFLHIEITESAFNDDTIRISEIISCFRKAGYKVWMDDFGSGYSSLNNLKNYDFDLVKIDMAFLKNFATNQKGPSYLGFGYRPC